MISIIIPTLNEEKYLPRMLDSLAEQTIEEKFEVIISDAGSSDKTKEIAKTYGCRVVEGGTPAKGRNQGAVAAEGSIYVFIDAEAVISKDFLEKAIGEFNRRKLDVAGCVLEPETEHFIPKMLYNLYYNFPITLLENIFPYASSCIISRKDAYRAVGGFDETVKIAEDHAFARAVAKIGKFGVLRSVKQGFVPRRYQKEGEINTSFKYFLCNLYNVFLGEVRSDIFNYEFGQYNKKKNIGTEEEQGGFLSGFGFFAKPHWLIFALILGFFGFISWVIIFLAFLPKAVIFYSRKLFKFIISKA